MHVSAVTFLFRDFQFNVAATPPGPTAEGGPRVLSSRDVRNECECQSECEKRPLAKPDHIVFDMRSFSIGKKRWKADDELFPARSSDP